MGTYVKGPPNGLISIDTPGVVLSMVPQNGATLKSAALGGTDDPNFQSSWGPPLPAARCSVTDPAYPGRLVIYWDGPKNSIPNGKYNILANVIATDAGGTDHPDFVNVGINVVNQVATVQRAQTRTWLR